MPEEKKLHTVNFYGQEIPEALHAFILSSPEQVRVGEEQVKMAKSHAKKRNSSVAAEIYYLQLKNNEKPADLLRQKFEDDMHALGYKPYAALRQTDTQISAVINYGAIPLQILIASHEQARQMVEDLKSKQEKNDESKEN